MSLRINNAAISNAELLYRLNHCANTTVGSEKYQFYCQTVSNLNGACTRIPSQYLRNGLDCPVMATDAWLDRVYAETGLSCSINCYYYGYGIPTINIPTINVPTFTFPTVDYTTKAYTTKTPATVVPVPTYASIPIVPVANASSLTSSASQNTLIHSASSTTGAASSTATLGTGSQISSAKNLSPNILLLVVLLFSIMTLCRRII